MNQMYEENKGRDITRSFVNKTENYEKGKKK
jgi:hypothetical protein